MYNKRNFEQKKYENPNVKNLFINIPGERFKDRPKDHFSPGIEEKESLTPQFSPKFQYKKKYFNEIRSPVTPNLQFLQSLSFDEEDLELLKLNGQIQREIKEMEDKETIFIEQSHETSCIYSNLKLDLDYLDKKIRL